VAAPKRGSKLLIFLRLIFGFANSKAEATVRGVIVNEETEVFVA
jgi:hypothetical protein